MALGANSQSMQPETNASLDRRWGAELLLIVIQEKFTPQFVGHRVRGASFYFHLYPIN